MWIRQNLTLLPSKMQPRLEETGNANGIRLQHDGATSHRREWARISHPKFLVASSFHASEMRVATSLIWHLATWHFVARDIWTVENVYSRHNCRNCWKIAMQCHEKFNWSCSRAQSCGRSASFTLLIPYTKSQRSLYIHTHTLTQQRWFIFSWINYWILTVTGKFNVHKTFTQVTSYVPNR